MKLYTVYLAGGEVKVAEAEGGTASLPAGADLVLMTTDQAEVAGAVGECALRGYRWAGNDWLEAPTYRCGKCRQPAGPDGEGGFRHAEPVDAVACEAMFGGGMLRSLFSEED